MSVITIAGTDYNLPEQGTNPPWGTDLSAIITALTAVTNTLNGPADILTTSFTITNNTPSVSNVTGAAFDTASVRSAIISYSLYRSSTTTEMCETGQIYLSYKSTAGAWEIAQYYSGTSGVVFTITAGGQLQYTSTNFGGSSYVGKMKFNAKSFLQA